MTGLLERRTLLAAGILALALSGRAAAQEIASFGPAPGSRVRLALRTAGDLESESGESGGRFTYGLFLAELLAFAAKEILDDSPEEYAGSAIPSRLSRSMTGSQSRFGEHCLTVAAEIGGHLREASGTAGLSSAAPPEALSRLLGAAGAALALGEVWNALRNRIENRSDGFSLDPKVGTKEVAVSLTVRW